MKKTFRSAMMDEGEIEKYMHRLQEKQNQARLALVEGPAESEFLVFGVGGEEYAVQLPWVKATTAVPRVTPVPFMPAYYRGVVNLRGRIVSVIDLRTKMGMEAELHPETALVILETGKLCIGVVVDSVNRVLAVKEEHELSPVKLLDIKTLNGGI